MDIALAFFLLSTGVSGLSGCIHKQWVPNTNYNNPGNWLNGIPPGVGSIPVFPDGLELGVVLPPGDTVLPAMVLPRNGEIFLPKSGGRLTIAGGAEGKSVNLGDKEKLVYWKRKDAKAWLDPFNWKHVETNTDVDADCQSDAVPHVERVPCANDIVVFPADSGFRVILPDIPVSVANIKLWKQDLTNTEWLEFLNSDAGSRDFIGREETLYNAVSIERSSCTDKAGCVCGEPKGQHSREALLGLVCGYAEKTCPKEAACYDPVKPIGHCCYVCGAVLQLEIDNAKFEIDALRRHMVQYRSDEEYGGVASHVSRTGETHAQMVLVDQPGKYEEHSVRLAAILEKDLQDGKFQGVVSVTVHTAGHRVLGSRWLSVTSTMFGSLLVVIVCMGLLYVMFVVHPPGLGLPSFARFQNVAQSFQFARFDNVAGEGDERTLQFGGEICDDEPYDPTRQAFDNPMYDQAKDITGGQESGTSQDEEQREVTHENPVYSVLQRKETSKRETEEEEDEEEAGLQDKFEDVTFVET